MCVIVAWSLSPQIAGFYGNSPPRSTYIQYLIFDVQARHPLFTKQNARNRTGNVALFPELKNAIRFLIEC